MGGAALTLRVTKCGFTPPEELCLPIAIPGEPDGAWGAGGALTWTRLLVGERPEGLGKVLTETTWTSGEGMHADTSRLDALHADVPIAGAAMMLIGAIGLTACWTVWIKKKMGGPND